MTVSGVGGRNSATMHRPKSRLGFWTALLAATGLAAGCRGPAFYEKSAFADPVMAFDETAGELHFLHKVVYSMEGSIGGFGGGAGGGCGCY